MADHLPGLDGASPVAADPTRVDDLGLRAALDRLTSLAALLLDASRAAVDLEGAAPDRPPGTRHALSVPIRDASDRTLGALTAFSDAPRDWSERDRAVLATVADAAAAEAARSATLERERAAAGHAELLHRAAVELSRHNDASSVLEALARSAVPALGTWCTIHLPDRADGVAATAGRWDTAPADAARLDAAVTAALGSGQEEVVPLTRDPADREALVLPLVARHRTLAVMVLAGADGHSPLRAEGGEVARALASRAVVALENALLHDAQAAIAATLAQALLPRALPELDGLQLSARYRAAGRTDQVGGDFYDVFTRQEDGLVAFVVGDVVGKGAGAASLTSVVRHTLRAAFLRGDGPREAVELANRALGDIVTGSEFCTAVYGELERHAGGAHVRLVRAGHLPPLLVRARGHVEVLEPAGGLLGPMATTETEVLDVALAVGGALVLVTDGVTELGDRGGPEGDDALRDLLAARAGESARTLAEAVERQAVVLSDGAPRDDVAVLVLRVGG